MASPPKKSMIPLLLFFLLCVSTLFLLTLKPTSTSTSSTPITYLNHESSLIPTQHFTLIIKLLTFNRLSSLSRCLRSLSNAHYDNSTVHLHIFIDHFRQPTQDQKGPSDLDEKLNLSRRILDFVDEFKWDFGEKVVHYRTLNVGLQAQWLEAWWPTSDHEFAFVVEDDLEVSPLYFRFLKTLILNYYYNQSNFSPIIYGASLQRPRFVPGKHGNKMHLDSRTSLFLYQLVGTWGQLLFPRPWKEFRLWYDTHKAKDQKPFLDGMVTTGWYKKMGERIWTPWFIKFIQTRGYFNFYTNFMNERALSVSHRDAGVNYGKSVGPDSYLVDENSSNLNLLGMQPLTSLKWYDFCFREVILNRIVRSFDELELILNGIQKSSIILVNLQGASESTVRNLLCHFERLSIGNYIFVGSESSLLLDLARRGHPVIDVDKFLESVHFYKSKRFQESSREMIKEILVIAYVTKKSLELKYNTWVVDSNMVPVSSIQHFDSSSHTRGFHVGKNFKLLYIASSSAASKIWVDDFLYKAVEMANSFRTKDSVSLHDNFVHAVETLLEQNSVKYDKLNEMQFTLDIDSVDSNQTSLETGKKFVSWSSQLDSEIVQKKLRHLGLWVVDDELCCKAVVCNSS